MTFGPTGDLGLVRSIITHPRVYRFASDDFSPAAEEYQPIDHACVTYLLVRDGEELLGLFMLVRQSPIITDVHTCLLPSSWGARAAEAARGGAGWVFDNTTAERITTTVPAYNRLAYRFALAAGMSEYGRLPRSFQQNNKLHDQILLSVSREEYLKCQQQ